MEASRWFLASLIIDSLPPCVTRELPLAIICPLNVRDKEEAGFASPAFACRGYIHLQGWEI